MQEELEAEEKEEEEEAKMIQKRLAANLSEEDYEDYLNFFRVNFFFVIKLSCAPAVTVITSDGKKCFFSFLRFMLLSK